MTAEQIVWTGREYTDVLTAYVRAEIPMSVRTRLGQPRQVGEGLITLSYLHGVKVSGMVEGPFRADLRSWVRATEYLTRKSAA